METSKRKNHPSSSEWSLLVVEDDPISSKLVCEILKRHGVSTISCGSIQEAKSSIRNHPDIGGIILDLGLPDGDGIDFMRSVRKALPQIPCMILTARDHAQSAVIAMKAGASDYITKPFEPDALLAFVSGPMQVYCQDHAIDDPARIRNSRPKLWKSQAMLDALQRVWQAADSNSPVMLLGACSTGKTALAEFLHQNSSRANEKLATYDAAAIRNDQIVNGLFGNPTDTRAGNERGRGRMAANGSGSVYIENIDQLDSHAQAAMIEWHEAELRFMERGIPSPRLITSSCINLQQAVHQGKFREDLWYALSVFQIHVPEIHDRIEDIPLLCEQFITRICVTRKLRRPTLTRQAMEILTRYNWPGNLSELHNVLEHAVNRTHDGLIGPRELPPLRASPPPPKADFPAISPIGNASIEEITRASLVAALDACGGNRRKAAQQLKVSLRTIYNMIQRYEIGGKRQKQPDAN